MSEPQPPRPAGGSALPAPGRPAPGQPTPGRAPGDAAQPGAAQAGPAQAGAGPAGPPQPGAGSAGPALARAALEAALTRRRAQVRSKQRSAGGDGQPARRRRGYTGPGPDPRDPQPLANVLNNLVKARGWQQPRAEATVFGAWERIVGAEIAAHSRPVKLERGELTVEAESTAWATQLRLLAGRLLGSIATEVGRNVVTKLHIHGPVAPSWSRGPRRVRGRGPRDTYG